MKDSFIPISRLGPDQLQDISHDTLHNGWARVCTVQGAEGSKIGDRTPEHLATLYGKEPAYWNKTFVVQVAGCPLHCWYCYVDNLKPDFRFTPEELVREFSIFRRAESDLHVFHLMGGCPGRYAAQWPAIREALDAVGYKDVVFMSNVVLVEEATYGVRPWEYIPPRSLISICVKNSRDGIRDEARAREEAKHYLGRKDVVFTLVEEETPVLSPEWLRYEQIDFLQLYLYKATMERLRKVL